MKLVKVLVLVGIAALAVPQIAAAADTKSDLGVVVGYIYPMSDSTINTGEESVKAEADSAVDYGLTYKYKFRENMSVGASLLYASHDIKGDGQKVGTITNMPLLFDFNFHLLKGKNLYVGATVGYAWWGNIDNQAAGEPDTKVKQNWVYGLNLGFDIPIGDKWAVLTNVRYLGQKVETDEPSNNVSVNVNPLVANVGFAYRW